jgi:hypothetical protein
MRPGGSGAAETFEPRQIREEAAVRGSLWAPPGRLPGYANTKRAVLVRTALFVFREDVTCTALAWVGS